MLLLTLMTRGRSGPTRLTSPEAMRNRKIYKTMKQEEVTEVRATKLSGASALTRSPRICAYYCFRSIFHGVKVLGLSAKARGALAL